MSELVRRLRETGQDVHYPECLEAAERIAQLEAVVEAADMGEKFADRPFGDTNVVVDVDDWNHLRQTLEALEQKETPSNL